jgi:hypothetical protein
MADGGPSATFGVEDDLEVIAMSSTSVLLILAMPAFLGYSCISSIMRGSLVV